MTYDKHVTNVVSSCMNILSQINRVRHLFSQEDAMCSKLRCTNRHWNTEV